MLPAVAFTQNAISQEADSLVTGLQYDDLSSIIVSLGHSVRTESEDINVITAETEDGFLYTLEAAACNDNQDCKGLSIMASYNSLNGTTPESINDADVAYAAVSVWTTGETIGISRYLILDEGMTMENIKLNINTLLAIAPLVLEKAKETSSVSTSGLQYGDDSGDYAYDDACDDARFHTDGDEYNYKREHVMHDATDCRADMESGAVSLILDFGNNEGEYADDDTCDDVRFEGTGRSILTTDSHIKRDSADCITAYQDGTISVR